MLSKSGFDVCILPPTPNDPKDGAFGEPITFYSSCGTGAFALLKSKLNWLALMLPTALLFGDMPL